jgi:hypothetical protein
MLQHQALTIKEHFKKMVCRLEMERENWTSENIFDGLVNNKS